MKRQHSILFGNGFNRLTNEELCWKNFLNNAFPNNQEKDIVTSDYSMLYEKILLDEYKQFHIAINDFEDSKKTSMAKAVEDFTPNEETINLLERLANLPVCYYMTTNYDTTFDKVLSKGKLENVQKDYSEPFFSLHRRHTVKEKNVDKQGTVWYLHGETGNVKTMSIGFDQYCISLGSITNYLIHGSQSEVHLTEQYKDRLSSFKSENKGEWFPYILWRLNQRNQIKHWVDLFFLTDVHIIAQGLAFSEIDIWWLLNKRARFIEAAKKSKYPYQINNRIYYYGQCSPEQRAMLEAFGVTIINISRTIDKDDKTDYFKYYNGLIEKMEQIII